MVRKGSDKRLSRLYFVAVAAALAFASLGAASASTTQAGVLPTDLARALETYNQATTQNDTMTLAALVTDDYVLVNSDTSVQDNKSYLADFEVPGFRVDPYTIEQPIYRVSADSALTGGIFRLGWTQESRHQSRRLRIAHFWVRQDGVWRIAYTQLTRVPE